MVYCTLQMRKYANIYTHADTDIYIHPEIKQILGLQQAHRFNNWVMPNKVLAKQLQNLVIIWV